MAMAMMLMLMVMAMAMVLYSVWCSMVLPLCLLAGGLYVLHKRYSILACFSGWTRASRGPPSMNEKAEDGPVSYEWK
jgi:hypothetical protein